MWLLLGLLAVFVILYGIRTFKQEIYNAMNCTDKETHLFAKDPFNGYSKSHLKWNTSEIPIESANSFTKAKATRSSMTSQKVTSNINGQAELIKLREIKK